MCRCVCNYSSPLYVVGREGGREGKVREAENALNKSKKSLSNDAEPSVSVCGI